MIVVSGYKTATLKSHDRKAGEQGLYLRPPQADSEHEAKRSAFGRGQDIRPAVLIKVFGDAQICVATPDASSIWCGWNLACPCSSMVFSNQ